MYSQKLSQDAVFLANFLSSVSCVISCPKLLCCGVMFLKWRSCMLRVAFHWLCQIVCVAATERFHVCLSTTLYIAVTGLTDSPRIRHRLISYTPLIRSAGSSYIFKIGVSILLPFSPSFFFLFPPPSHPFSLPPCHSLTPFIALCPFLSLTRVFSPWNQLSVRVWEEPWAPSWSGHSPTAKGFGGILKWKIYLWWVLTAVLKMTNFNYNSHARPKFLECWHPNLNFWGVRIPTTPTVAAQLLFGTGNLEKYGSETLWVSGLCAVIFDGI